jgi:hypothetical protein
MSGNFQLIGTCDFLLIHKDMLFSIHRCCEIGDQNVI